MGRKRDLDLVVDVGPFGMVVGLLGRQRHLGHEPPGLGEVRELEAALDRIAARNFLPFLQAAECVAARLAGEFAGHGNSSSCGAKLASSEASSLGLPKHRRLLVKLSRRTAMLTAASAAVASPALAQKSADTLRIQFVDAVPNVDMYFNSQRTGLILAHQAWDMLVHRDPATFEIKPSLATDWRFAEDNTLDLNIRQGVKFHDGSTLSVDDVVYTINMAANPESKVATPSNYAWIAKAEKTGDFAVRIHMKKPTPAALEYLAMVTPIHPKAYREKVGPEGFSAKPIGAGPYKIVKNDQGKEVVFERFEEYWAGSPKGKPAIKTLQVRFVPDLATSVTELLAQRADWIWNINPDQMDSINKMPYLQAVRQESMRVGYLSIDAAGRSGAGNPLTNLKVRQAIWHAVNRQEFADKLVGGGSRVPPAPCFPSQFGCDAAAAVKYDYDPAKAKALMAEAGFANGFDIEFVSYVQPTSWPAAVQNYLAAVGIRARINQLQVTP